jgi:hypothetical protein
MTVDEKPVEPTEEDVWKELAAEEEGEKIAEIPEKDKDAPTDEAAAEVAATDQQQDQDPWANAPPDLKAAHDAQVKALETATNEHARRSIEGRIASYTRRLKERNEAAAQKPAAPKPEEAADPLEELAADYPEIAAPLQKDRARIAEKISRFESIEQSRLAAADAEMDHDLMANEKLLEESHPGWEGYLKEYGPAFGAWIVDQPLALRQAFVTNQDAIIDPYSAIETLAAFKSFVASNQSPQAPPPDGGGQPAQQQRLNPRRAAQLAGSASPHSGGSRPTVSGIPQDGDPEMIWKQFAAIDEDEKKYRSA